MVDTNVIYCGDCKDVLKKILDESIDLIYLDPPFFSQKHYEDFWVEGKGDHETKMGFSDKDWEKLRHSIDPNILKEYKHIEARWKGGHKGIYVYIAYMRERLIQCERVLKKTGSIYLHCDWHAGHYLKVLMDEIFGYDMFRNEIIWHYKRWPAKQTQFQRMHDTIYFYTKQGKPKTFNKPYSPLADITVKIHGGKKQLAVIKGDHRWSKDQKEKSVGTPTDDVWDISTIAGNAKERLGYPTQKPEVLLHRIIEASSNSTDIILDPFCGCGTTLAVAKRLGRQFIGIDISRTACDVMKRRVGDGVKIIGGESPEELEKMEPHEFARFIIVEKLNGTVNPKKTGDMGIDGWIEFKTVPVQVKRWAHKVSRPEIDKFRTAIERDKKEKAVMVANEFTRDCYTEVARIHKEDKIKIHLVTVKDVLNIEKQNQLYDSELHL